MKQALEAIRNDAMKRMAIAGSTMGVFFLIFLLIMPHQAGGVLGIGTLLIVIVEICIYQDAHKKCISAYKNMFLKVVLEKEFDDVQVNFEEGLSEDFIRDGHLVSLYDRFHSDDYISGRYKGVSFECSDVHIQDVVRSGKTTTVVTRFQGLYLIVPLRKQFHGWLVVREREFLDNGNPRGWLSDMPYLEKVEMEDEQFNQTFSVYASDGQEAFYLLTPRFLEELKQVERSVEGRCLFGFLNGKLHVAVDSRTDHFDLSLFERVDELKMNQHRQEIELIKGLLECVMKECEEA